MASADVTPEQSLILKTIKAVLTLWGFLMSDMPEGLYLNRLNQSDKCQNPAVAFVPCTCILQRGEQQTTQQLCAEVIPFRLMNTAVTISEYLHWFPVICKGKKKKKVEKLQ